MRWHRLLLITLASFLPAPSLGTYVQVQRCDDLPDSAAWPGLSLDASLQPTESGHELELWAVTSPRRDGCESAPHVASASLAIGLLGDSASYAPLIDNQCQADQSRHGANVTMVHLSQPLDHLYPLAVFQADLRLFSPVAEEVACISAQITPEIAPATRDALTYTSLAVLLALLAMAYYQILFNDDDDDDDEPVTGSGASVLDDSRSGRSGTPLEGVPSIISGVGECLQHLQFVFLTGALSLQYPGYFQPSISYLNWYSLFSSDNIFLKGRTYGSVDDGIYMINGTYGGTSTLR